MKIFSSPLKPNTQILRFFLYIQIEENDVKEKQKKANLNSIRKSTKEQKELEMQSH